MVLEGAVCTCFVWIVRRAIVLGGCWQAREDVGCLLFLELSVLEVVVLVVSVFLDPRSYPLKVLTGSVGVGAPVGSLSFRDIWGRSFSGINDFVRWLIDFHLPWCNTVYAARLLLQNQCCSTSLVCFYTAFEFVLNLWPAMGVVLSVLVAVISVLRVSLLVLSLFCQLSPAIPVVDWGWVLVGNLWLVFRRVQQQAKFRFAGMVHSSGPWVLWRLCRCLAFQFMGWCFQEACVWLFSVALRVMNSGEPASDVPFFQ